MLRLMKAPSLSVVLLLPLLACDEPKKPAPPAASAAPSTSPSAIASALAAISSAKPVKKKVDCPPSGEVTVSDRALEDEIRRKLGKDGGTLSKADLAQVK